MLDRILQFVELEKLFTKRDRILVGYSGGADSTCLLHALAKLGFDCVAGYLHHGQRAEADAELESCAEFAGSIDIPFISGRADVPQLAQNLGVGLEEAGREARYHFFERAARQFECTHIATAHTQSDQAETVLLNMVRGSGLKGLRGIPIKRENIVRPLLAITREETVRYCIEHELSYVNDPANHDLSFSRARIRIKVVPELRAINPNLSETVFRMAEIVAEEDDFLDGMAAAALEQCEIVPNPDLAFLTKHLEFRIDRRAIETLPAVLFKRAVRLGTSSLGGRLESRHTLALAEGIRERPNGSFTAPEGSVSVSWNEETVTFTRKDSVAPFKNPLELGILESDEMGWKISSKPHRSSGSPTSRTSLVAEFPLNALSRPLYVRNVETGDKMRPVGFDFLRKVSDLLSEAKVTRLARERIPLVCDMLGPIWLPGVCLDDRMSGNGTPADAIFLTFEPL